MPNFYAMPVEHVIYIPLAMLVGVVIGYLLGARTVRAEIERQRRKLKD